MTTNDTTLTYFIKQNGLIDNGMKYPYKLCRITPITDLSKPSYVEYYVYDETAQKLRRRRYVLSQETKAERQKAAREFSKAMNAALIKGLLFNPIPSNHLTIAFLNKESLLTEGFQNFLNLKKLETRKKTFEGYRTDIRRVEKFLAKYHLTNVKIGEFTKKEAVAILDHLLINEGLSKKSRNNVRGTCYTFFEFLIDRKIIIENPFAKIPNLKTTSNRNAAIPEHYARMMKEQCIKQNEHQLLLYFMFVYYCAIRSGNELKLLKIEDIKKNTIFISGDRTKNAKGRHAIIPTALEKLIQEYNLRKFPSSFYVFSNVDEPGPEPLTRDYIYNKHRKMLKILNLDGKNYTVYSWKHTGVIALWKATQDIELIRDHCGHEDVAITTRYLRDLGQFTDYSRKKEFPEL